MKKPIRNLIRKLKMNTIRNSMSHLIRNAVRNAIKGLEKEGVEGKTFLEVGCGPCPIGKLVSKIEYHLVP